MTNTRRIRPRNLGDVEQAVMDYVWSHGPCTADACREALAGSRPMKDSTIRTVLRRLEAKGYVGHELEGRTFIYRAAEARENVAARAVKNIIDRFCDGSAEQLVMGMVDSNVLGRKDLERMARKIAQSRQSQSKSSVRSGARPSGKDDKP
jgi:predicted transcriptional regulator